MSRYLIRRTEDNPAIVLRTRAQIVALEGNGHLERVRWRDDRSGGLETNDIRHVFMMTGAVPRCGRLLVRFTALSCCRSAMFSKTNS